MKKIYLLFCIFIFLSCAKEYRRAFIYNLPDATIFGIVIYDETNLYNNIETADFKRIELTEYRKEGEEIVIVEKGIKPKILSTDFDKYVDFPLNKNNQGFYFSWRSLKLGSCYYISKIGFNAYPKPSSNISQNNNTKRSYDVEFSYSESGKFLEFCHKKGQTFIGILGYNSDDGKAFNYLENPKISNSYINTYLYGLNKPNFRGAEQFVLEHYNINYAK